MHFAMRHIISTSVALIVSVVFFGVLAHSVLAVSDSFLTRMLIGGDTAPPTVPSSLVATPISQTQIDISWSPSTDDWAVSGYRVWRDEVNIATTTLTTYSDTGLASSTLYSYYITAFDAAGNQSASSTSVATTTLSPSPVTADEEVTLRYGSRGTPFDEMIVSLQIFPQKDSVVIRYETKKHVRAVVKWGTGVSYELGSLMEQSLGLMHETRIEGLDPGTQYSFVIDGEDAIGRYGELYLGIFETLSPDDIFPPGNVTNLSTKVEGDDVLLSWTNPEDPDFTKVRVLRSDLFYPSDIADGWVVYEGAGDTIRDEGIVTKGETQFYTIFTYDDKGNISSGAVTRVQFGTTTVEVVDPLVNPIELSLDDIQIIQGNVPIPHEDGVFFIDGSRQLVISIPYDKVPEHLKTILVRVGDGHTPERTFEFLLRVDAERTKYSGTIAPFGVSGEFSVGISVFDFETKQIGYTKGTFSSHIRPIHIESESDSFMSGILKVLGSPTSMVGWLLILVLILLYMTRRLLRAVQ